MPVSALPTGPSAPLQPIVFTPGLSGPMDVVFPGRADAFEFRNALETKYQTGLGRAMSSTYVDREGEVVWTQEYIRYRSNGCDHNTAQQRVMTQIDGGAAGGICAAPSTLFGVEFPTRADVLEFRRALEIKYQLLGRGLSQSFVDMEGRVIWIQEYLRYRVNDCDHVTATQKVFSQIDGGPVPATCFVPCSYLLTPGTINIGPAARSGTLEIRPNPVACDWKAASDATRLTFPSEFGGGRGYTLMPYRVEANSLPTPRTGKIVVTYATGSQAFTVNQEANPFTAGIQMTDLTQAINNVRECQIRRYPTTCTLRAFSNLPGGNHTYAWSVGYFYCLERRLFLQRPERSDGHQQFTDVRHHGGLRRGRNDARRHRVDVERPLDDYRRPWQLHQHRARRARPTGAVHQILQLLERLLGRKTRVLLLSAP